MQYEQTPLRQTDPTCVSKEKMHTVEYFQKQKIIHVKICMYTRYEVVFRYERDLSGKKGVSADARETGGFCYVKHFWKDDLLV